MAGLYCCNMWGNTFTFISNLEIHEIIHTGERQYACNSCGKAFSQKGYLKVHERIHTGARPYVCNTCRKEFRQLGHLKRHERIHTGEKPYVCNTCRKEFSQLNQVRRHERIHSGEKPYICKICTKAFNQLGNLKSHERIHSGKKPFICHSCGKAFSCRAYAIKHHTLCTGQKLQCANHLRISKKSSSKDSRLKNLNNIDVGQKSVDMIFNKQEKKSLFAVKPFGCGVCDKIFVEETQFLKHCSLHFGDSDLSEDLTFLSDCHKIVSHEKLEEGFAIREMSSTIKIESNADEVKGKSLRWFGRTPMIN